MFNFFYQRFQNRFLWGMLCCVMFFCVAKVQASVFEDTLWESAKIPDAVFGTVSGDWDADRQPDLAYVTRKQLFIGHFGFNGETGPSVTLPAAEGENFHRLAAGDFDRDGADEIVVTGFGNGRPFSRIYQWTSGKWGQTQEFEQTVLPLFWQGEVRLFSQGFSARGEWNSRLNEIRWTEKGYQETGAGIRLGHGIGSFPVSLFALAGLDQELAYLHPEGHVLILEGNGRKIWKSGLKFGGAVDWLDFTGKDPLGIRREVRFSLPPRLSFDPVSRLLYTVKNSGFLPSAIGAFPNLKSAQFTVLERGDAGFQELKSSRNFDGAISDISLIDFDGDGVRNELLLTLWSRQGGVLDVSRPQVSILVVVRGSGVQLPPVTVINAAGTGEAGVPPVEMQR